MRTLVVDLETSNLSADIGSLLVACFGELGPDGTIVETHSKDLLDITSKRASVERREKLLAEWTRDMWESADIIIGHNSKAFDRNFLQGVMFRQGLGMLNRNVLHVDTYMTARGQLRMSGRMANLVDIFKIGEKDAPHKDDWRAANHLDPDALARIRERCVSDVEMTAKMWETLKPIYIARWGK